MKIYRKNFFPVISSVINDITHPFNKYLMILDNLAVLSTLIWGRVTENSVSLNSCSLEIHYFENCAAWKKAINKLRNLTYI